MVNFYLLFFGFLLTILLTKITIRLAAQRQLFEANDHRKLHSETVSALGGIPIFIGFWVMTAGLSVPLMESMALFISTGILLIIGVEDDFKNTKVSKRLIAQVIAGTIAFVAGFHLGWEGSWWLCSLNYVATIFLLVLLINSFNFIDGINGLAGGLGMITMLVLGGLLFQFQLSGLAILAVAYAVALGGFLLFNFGNNAAIFMGDNGSTVLGFLTGVFALKIFQLSVTDAFPASIPMVCALLAIPILDLVYVALARMIKGNSPFIGDRNHIHHLLIQTGRSHPSACYLIGTWLLGLLLILSLQTTTLYYTSLLLIVGSYLLVRIYYTKGKIFAINRMIIQWRTTIKKV